MTVIHIMEVLGLVITGVFGSAVVLGAGFVLGYWTRSRYRAALKFMPAKEKPHE